MGRGSPHPDREVPRHEIPDRVDGGRTSPMFCGYLGDEAAAFLPGQLAIGLVMQTGDRPALMMIPHASLKKNKPAAIPRFQFRPQGRGVDRMRLNQERHLLIPRLTAKERQPCLPPGPGSRGGRIRH